MKINEVEALSGIPKKNIRFYEEQGLLSPRRNPENGYRDYGDSDVEVLRRIRLLRKLDVPIDEIRLMLSGAHTVGDGMRRHLICLERQQRNLQQAAELCQELSSQDIPISQLDPQALLERMESMEHSGTRFRDVTAQDIKKRYIAPVTVTALVLTLMVALIWLFLWAFETDPAGAPPLPLLAVFIAVPTVVALGVIVSLVQRIREIGRREIDDARQF